MSEDEPTRRPVSAIVLDDGALGALVGRLGDEGRTVVAPVVTGPVVSTDVVTSIDEVARGHDDQRPGHYRFTPDAGADVARPAQSWKRWFQHETEIVVRARRDDDGIRVEPPTPPPPPVALFGIRSCDVAALGIVDRVLAEGPHPDDDYVAARHDAVIVAVACTTSGPTCFCASMGTGPAPTSGADVVLTRLPGTDEDTSLVAEAHTPRGAELLAGLADSRPATRRELDAAHRAVDAAAASQVRRLDPAEARHLPVEHPHWDRIAERCLTCGNCTMSCPTCFCTSWHDRSDLAGAELERHRVWETCFSLDFTEIHGGHVRTSTTARYRHWLLHKLVTWHAQFGSSGCVGCGRCITWCPTGIDLTAEVPVLAREAS